EPRVVGVLDVLRTGGRDLSAGEALVDRPQCRDAASDLDEHAVLGVDGQRDAGIQPFATARLRPAVRLEIVKVRRTRLEDHLPGPRVVGRGVVAAVLRLVRRRPKLPLRRRVLARRLSRGEVEGPRAPDAAGPRPVVRRAVEREEAVRGRDVREPAVSVPRDRRAVVVLVARITARERRRIREPPPGEIAYAERIDLVAAVVVVTA